MGTPKNCLSETILLSTHNIGLYGQIRILEHEKRPLSRALDLPQHRLADEPFPTFNKSAAVDFK